MKYQLNIASYAIMAIATACGAFTAFHPAVIAVMAIATGTIGCAGIIRGREP